MNLNFWVIPSHSGGGHIADPLGQGGLVLLWVHTVGSFRVALVVQKCRQNLLIPVIVHVAQERANSQAALGTRIAEIVLNNHPPLHRKRRLLLPGFLGGIFGEPSGALGSSLSVKTRETCEGAWERGLENGYNSEVCYHEVGTTTEVE
jgi:hypothetical protein